MSVQGKLFGADETGPVRRDREALVIVVTKRDPADRPQGWRAPTKGEHVCVGCDGAACYGLHTQWFCASCVPAGFLPARTPA